MRNKITDYFEFKEKHWCNYLHISYTVFSVFDVIFFLCLGFEHHEMSALLSTVCFTLSFYSKSGFVNLYVKHSNVPVYDLIVYFCTNSDLIVYFCTSYKLLMLCWTSLNFLLAGSPLAIMARKPLSSNSPGLGSDNSSICRNRLC